MPLCFGSSNKGFSTDPQIRQVEKRISEDARIDQKNLDHAVSDLQKAEKSHLNAIKAADKAQHALDNAIEKEHKAATALNRAQHQHQTSISEHQNAEKTLELKRQHQARLEQDLQQRRSTMEDFQHRKDTNDQFRETRLSEIHADAASRAGSRANSINRGPYPIGRGAIGGPEKMHAEPKQDVVTNDSAGMNGATGAGRAGSDSSFTTAQNTAVEQ
ncbi:hypothetical protein EIP86_001045 [Pleurotus ostreatoroseus]|nr:hypothetical protein EIP86_001045 [Pleurotus ostreatoroseus]